MEIYDLPQHLTQNDVRVEQTIKQQKEYKLLGKVLRKPGLTLFSYNTQTGEMKPAEMERTCAITFGGDVAYSTKVKVEQHCIYGQALNMKNWQKRVARMIKSV